jgi:hypothetical protein
MRKLLVGGALALAGVAGVAAPAFAHDCFNPTKPAGAGVHYTIEGFNPDGSPILSQTAQGKGIGGFVAFDPALIGGTTGVEVHTIGNSTIKGNNPHEVVGGPGTGVGSQSPDHACNGKGIDYLDACNPGLAQG